MLEGTVELFAVVAVICAGLFYFIRSKRSKVGGSRAKVTDIRPYMYEDSDKEKKYGVTIIYEMDDGKKGKVNLSETTCKERFPDLQIGDRLVKSKDDSIPKKE